jgi:hypothetical protein
MTQQHPITPPPELVHQWFQEGNHMFPQIAAKAAQWGADQAKADIKSKLQEAADQELEACRHWLEVNGAPRKFIDGLLAFRRPKPPSLKEINLKHLDVMQRDGHYLPEILQDLRRALEQLDD